MNDVILKRTEVHDGKVEFFFEPRGELKKYFTTDRMFVEYDRSVESVPISILNISFVASILPLMWLTDTVMWVDELDRTFYDCVFRLKNAYQELYSHIPLNGRLVAANPRENTYEIHRECLLLFSGGVDANTSYLRNLEKQPILCNIQGWQEDSDPVKQRASEADYRDVLAFANAKGLEFAFVKSNFATLIDNTVFSKTIQKRLGYGWWYGFQHSMSFISIAMPLAYLKGVRNIYIASSYFLGSASKCASYATTDIEFRFATYGGCVHDGFELGRQDKLHYLVNYQKASGESYPIRVCSFHDSNCCRCEKCFRTMLGIAAENGDVRNFGFPIEEPLKKHWNNILKQQLAQFGVESEQKNFWPEIISRMRENYQTIEDKEFVDWFLSYDFVGERKKALRKYYRTNFLKIVKRKLTNR